MFNNGGFLLDIIFITDIRLYSTDEINKKIIRFCFLFHSTDVPADLRYSNIQTMDV